MAQLILTNGVFSNLIDLIKTRVNDKATYTLLQCASQQPQNLVDNTGSTLLHYAVKFNNIRIVHILISLGCKYNLLNNEGHSPLMLAVMNNSKDLVEMLFKRISDAHYKKLLAVMFSCEKVDSKIVKLIFQKLKQTDDKRITNLLLETKCPLYHAVFLGRVNIIKKMIDDGCPVNVKNPFDGNSPLHVAVACGNVNLVRLLVKHVADVNAVNNRGEIPLNREKVYSSHEDLNILKILLDERSLLTSCDESGRMQMFKIFESESKIAIKMMSRSPINKNVQDQHGDTVIHYCAEYAPSNEIFALFVKEDFNPNIQNRSGYTPLHLLFKYANIPYDFQTIRLLIAKGADVNVKSCDGIPPLHNLVGRGINGALNIFCELLVEHAVDIQYVTARGETILKKCVSEYGTIITSTLTDVVYSYLALLEAKGTTIIEPIRRKIYSTDRIRSPIEPYRSKLEQLKTIELYESVTLFKLLACSKIKFRNYLRNKQLTTELRRVLANNVKGVDRMYIELLKIRMNEASNVIEWQQKAVVAFCKLVDSRFPVLIFNEVMDYLSLMDLKNLASIKCYTNKRKRFDSDENMCKRKCQ